MLAVVVALAAVSCAAGEAASTGGERPAVRLEYYDALALAEEHLQAGDVEATLGILTPLIEQGGNAHELALLHDLASTAHAERNDLQGALRHSLALLALGPDAPVDLAAAARESIPRLYAATGELAKAVESMQAWQREVANPPRESFIFLAETHYRMQAFREAIPPLETAIGMADAQGATVEEDWLTMLFAMLYERRQFERALAVAERLNRDFPTEQHRTNLISLRWKIARLPAKRERPQRPTAAPAPPPNAR